MKLVFLALLLTAASAQAYNFTFEFAQVFKSSDQMKHEFEKQVNLINSQVLQAKGMEARISSVEKNFSIHTVRGEVVGRGCEPSLQYFERFNIAGKYPVGVSEQTLEGIGFVLPHDTDPSRSLSGSWHHGTLLIPVCQ